MRSCSTTGRNGASAENSPRGNPVSFYHVSKVQGTFSVYEACKYWWLRSYDVMQGGDLRQLLG